MEFLKSNITEEWEDLVKEFPEFISELSPFLEDWYIKIVKHCEEYKLDAPNKEDLCNLRYGFECGVGWKDLIREYFIEIRKLIKTAKSNGHDVDYKTCIIKEKFGELRDQGDFYGDDRNMYISDYYRIGEMLHKSLNICEFCGEAGELSKRGWYKVRCEEHSHGVIE